MESLALKMVSFCRLVSDTVIDKETDSNLPVQVFIFYIGKPTPCSSPTGIKLCYALLKNRSELWMIQT